MFMRKGRPLYVRLAVELGKYETVKVLIEAGADLHIKNDYPLRWARENDHTEIAKLLEEAMNK